MNRKIPLKMVSIVVFLALLTTLIVIALNLYSTHYNTETVYAQGITVASPTANQQTTQQRGSQTTITLDLTNPPRAIGVILAIFLAAISAAILSSKPVIEGMSQILGAINQILGSINQILGAINSQIVRYNQWSQQRKLWKRLYSSIRRVEIPSFSQPLDINSMYVPAKVTQDSSMSLNVINRDINILLQEKQKDFEKRFNTAKDLQEAVMTCTPNDKGNQKFKVSKISEDFLLTGLFHRILNSFCFPKSDPFEIAPRCLLAGEAGIGKTVHLKHYALEYVYPKHSSRLINLKGLWRSITRKISGYKLPVYVELKEFVEAQETNLFNFIVRDCEQRYNLGALEKFIKDKLERGQAILLLDGLDSAFVGSTPCQTYISVTKQIELLGSNYPRTPIIVSTRDSHYQFYKEQQGWYLKDAGFHTWEPLGFCATDAEMYITKWSQCLATFLNQSNADRIKENLKQNPRIRSLVCNPLFLIHIITSFSTDLNWNLPDQRVNLYTKEAEMLMERWDKHRQINRVQPTFSSSEACKPQTRISMAKKFTVLEKIAWLFHERGIYYLREDELLHDRAIGHFIQTRISGSVDQAFPSILQEIVEDGLMKKHGEVYSFFCLPLQEYFAARNTKNDRKAGADLRKYSNDPWWEEVILLSPHI